MTPENEKRFNEMVDRQARDNAIHVWARKVLSEKKYHIKAGWQAMSFWGRPGYAVTGRLKNGPDPIHVHGVFLGDSVSMALVEDACREIISALEGKNGPH